MRATVYYRSVEKITWITYVIHMMMYIGNVISKLL